MAPRTRARSKGTPGEAPPKNDVYVGLLIISLLALVAGMVLLIMDYSQFNGAPKNPELKSAGGAPNAGGNQQPPPPGPGGPGGPGGPPGPGGPGGPPMPPGGPGVPPMPMQ